MARRPTFFDWMNVRDELRGITGESERRRVIDEIIESALIYFKARNFGFPFDYNTPRAIELWDHVEETCGQFARGECEAASLGGALEVWQVVLCEEYIARNVPERSEISAGASTGFEEIASGGHVVTNEEEDEQEEERQLIKAATTAATKRRGRGGQSKKPLPPPPADSSPQGSLFG